MRGKDFWTLGIPDSLRITPAYAGKSQIVVNLICGKQDHPRLCGEKDSPLLNSTLILGSPPPMRGKVTTKIKEGFGRRITPAYAGKSRDQTLHFQNRWDHPRLCGEKIKNHLNGILYPGSPPPMRGKAGNPAKCRRCPRITPAYAGKRTIA